MAAVKYVKYRPLQLPDRTLPNKVDLRPWMSPVEDQEELGSCTANAFAGVLEYLINRKYRRRVDVSRLFIYYNARRLRDQDHTIKDMGATLYHSTEALRRYGDCEETLWPYKKELVNKRPTDDVYDEAKRYTVTPIRMSFTVNSFRRALANDLPVVLGIILLHSAGTEARQNNGHIERPDAARTTVKNTQWHAIVCVGYDDTAKHFIVRNSWGKDWGLRGYFHLPYDYFSDNRLVDVGNGAWTIQDILYRTDHLPTMRYLKVENKKQYRRPRPRWAPAIYQRAIHGAPLSPNDTDQMAPVYNLYHRK